MWQISPLANDLSTKPISIDEAKTWFQQQQVGSANANPTGDSLLILPSVNPNWDSAFNSLNPQNRDYVIAPLDLSGDSGRIRTKLLVTRDSVGLPMGIFLTYCADEFYHTRTNGNYTPQDFSGKAIYSDLSGRFLYGFEISNGQRSYPIYAKRQDSNTPQIKKIDNAVSLRGCLPSTTTWFHCQDLQVFRSPECFVITIISYCPRLLPSFFGNNDVWVGGSSWGPAQPAALLFTATELLQVQKTFRDNGLFDLYETLQSNQAELRLVYNFLKLNSTNQANITLFKKYLEQGFSYPEFDEIFSVPALSHDADVFLSRYNFDSESRKAAKGVAILAKKNWLRGLDIDAELEEIKNAFQQEDDPILGLAIDLFVIDYKTRVAYLKKIHPDWKDYRVALEASRESVHLVLDICGIVPAWGEPCDLVNGVFYTIEGDGLNASLSFAATIPFAGWAATGAKLGVKITGVIGNSGRVYRLTYKIVGTVVEFGEKTNLRAQLRRILQTPTGYQAHHIVPLDLWNKDLVQAAAKDKAPFHINEFNNGINMSDLYHNGSHPDYSRRVEKAMKDIYDANGGSNITPHVAQQKLQELLNTIRNAIIANPTTNINNIIF